MQKLLTFFSKNISVYAIINDQSFDDTFNPFHAEYIKMPRPLPIFSRPDQLIKVVDINSHTE